VILFSGGTFKTPVSPEKNAKNTENSSRFVIAAFFVASFEAASRERNLFHKLRPPPADKP
jgi:hypothetical protein